MGNFVDGELRLCSSDVPGAGSIRTIRVVDRKDFVLHLAFLVVFEFISADVFASVMRTLLCNDRIGSVDNFEGLGRTSGNNVGSGIDRTVGSTA